MSKNYELATFDIDKNEVIKSFFFNIHTDKII